MSTELTQFRTYNTKAFDNNTAECHAGHIHYKDGAGAFVDTDYALVDKGTYWQMKKANYNLYVSKTFDDNQLIRFDNKFDGADHTIYFTPHSLQWIHKANPDDRTLIKAAQSVVGVMDNNSHTITYANAFGNNVDFVVELQRHRLKKYIRFNTQPTLNPPTANHVPVLLHKFQADGLTVKATGETAWDGVLFYEGLDGFVISESQAQYKTGISKAYIWDSSVRKNRQKIKLFFEKRNGVLWQAKVLPKNYFAGAIYPVMSDTTTSYFPDANQGDGFVAKTDEAVWADARDADPGNFSEDGDGTEGLKARTIHTNADGYSIERAFIPIDTAAIPDNATISAATLNVYLDVVQDDDNDAQAYITVLQTSQASTTELVVGDFADIGTTEGTDARLDLTGLATGQYHSWLLNATGRGWIDKTGITKLGLREGHDNADVPIADNTINAFIGTASEFAGTSRDPFLSVTFTVPVTVPIMTYHYKQAGGL